MPLGWGWSYVTDPVVQQVGTYIHAGFQGQATEWKQTAYAKALSEKFPERDGEPQKVLFCTTSQEALSIASDMAKFHTGNHQIVTSEHLNRIPEAAGLALELVDTKNKFDRVDTGLVQLAVKRAKEYNTPVLAAEHRTGFGRCGAFLAQEEWGVEADITVLGEAGGGGFAWAAVVAPAKYFDGFPLVRSTVLPGIEVACAAGINILGQMHEPLYENVRDVGVVLAEGISELQGEFPKIIEGCRGQGLCMGMQINPEHIDRFIALMQDYGVLLAPTPNVSASTVQLTPPLLISDTEVRWAVDQMALACLDIQQS